MSERHPSRPGAPSWDAWLVHAYTATGAVWALLAAHATVDGDLRTAFLWLFVAVFVDSTDGLLARRARVHERLPHFAGQKLDDIVDYLTFVFVPALIVRHAGLVSETWAVPVAAAMLLSSAYGFVSADAKTTDQFFTGFPSYWNIVVLYLVVFALPPVVNAVVLVGLSLMVFVRIGYVYPTRTEAWRVPTLALGSIWGIMILMLIVQLPEPRRWLAQASLFFPLYYTGLSLLLHARRPQLS